VAFTLAGVGHAARFIKARSNAADKYPVSRSVSRRSLATLASLVAVLALPAPAAASVVTEFSTGLTLANAPADITAGPDGNLWFTEQGLLPRVGKITTGGAITEYPIGLGNTPGEITVGPDDALWFTQRGASDAIVRVDPADGTMQEFPLSGGTAPTAITVGSDDNLWFIESGEGKLGRLQLDGTHDEFNAGLSGSDTLKDITSGPDGQLWVTIEGDDADEHRIESFSPSNPDDPCFWSTDLTGAPNQIVSASDGKLYFTVSDDPAAIGRIKTDGTIKEMRTGLTADSRPAGIAEGGDKALWFTASANPGRIGRMVRETQAFTEFAGGDAGLNLTPDAQPAGITRGPDGNIWFTESGLDGSIGRMTVPPAAGLELTQMPDLIGRRHDVTNGQLEAKVTANTQDTTYHVEYGPDSSFGEQSDDVTVPAGAGAEPVTEVVALTLEPDSHYHARLVATNGSGEAVSPELELWTDENGKLLDFEPGVPPVEVPKPKPTPPGKPADAGSQADEHRPVDLPAVRPVAPPVLGQAVVVRPLSGSVRVKAPGARAYSALASGANLPVGTLVDTRAGKIVLQSARNSRGRTQKGTFWGGVFQIRQRCRGRGMTSLHLRGGSFRRCGTRAGVSVLAHEAGGRRRVVRRLWGKDKHSRFRTHGRDSVATVRGTRWVTTDRCDGTLTKVTEGKVLVRDLRKKRKVLLSAGSAYLARHRR
jgi:streptogramin lyase